MKRWIISIVATGAVALLAALVLRKVNEVLEYIGETEEEEDFDLPAGVEGFDPVPQRDEGGA